MTSPAKPRGRLSRTRLSDELSAGLVDLIHEQQLGVGDQLDSMRSLAEHFEVAVPTLREALRRLEATGAVEMRHGSGVYVGPNVDRMVLANPAAGQMSPERLIELLAARLHLEPPIARLAAEVREPKGIVRVEAAITQAEALVDHPEDEVWLVHLEFHRAMGAVTGNPVIEQVIDSVLTVHAGEQKEILHIHGDAEQDLEEHRQIAEAVLAGDADLAEERTSSHLRGVLAVVERSARSAE